MKPLLWAALAVTLAAAPAWGGNPKSEPTALDPAPEFSKIDEVVIQIEDLDTWMAGHRSRIELREMNRAMGRVCERLRDVQAMVAALTRDREFVSDKARAQELKRFQASLTLLGGELSGWQTALRELAESQGVVAELATEHDRGPCEQARAAMVEYRNRLERESTELEQAVARSQGRSELSESARALGEVAGQLVPVLQSIERLQRDPALNRDCLSHINEAQARLGGVLQQLESCRSCVANLAPRS